MLGTPGDDDSHAPYPKQQSCPLDVGIVTVSVQSAGYRVVVVRAGAGAGAIV